MSHDGCEEVAWKGQAFPYFMHHPNGFHKTENYGAAASGGHSHGAKSAPKPSAMGDAESVFTAGTGTWNGPAPRGAGADARAAANDAALPAAAAGPVHEPATVRLASAGLSMPMVCLGMLGIKSPDEVKKALEIGYRGFDSAELYANEDILGEGLREFVASGRRDELFLISKLFNNHHRPELVRPTCEATLKALGVSCLDLYLVHWPDAWVPETGVQIIPDPKVDTTVTLQQTWAAMEALVDAGLVKAIGVSNFSLPQLESVLSTCRIPPAVNQVELHPMLAQRKLVGVSMRKGVVTQAYSPLGSQGQCTPGIQVQLLGHPTVKAVAEETGKTPAQVVLKWNTQRGVPLAAKASSEAHQRENFEGFFEWKLTNAQKARLDEMDEGRRFVDFDWHEWAPAEEGGVTKPSTVVF